MLSLACRAPEKPAVQQAASDSDRDGVSDRDDNCPGEKAFTRDGCVAEPATKVVLDGTGTYEPAPGESRAFKVKGSGDGPSELKPSTKSVEMAGNITYSDAAGKEQKSKVVLKGELVTKRDEALEPFSFVDMQLGTVVFQNQTELARYSEPFPVRLKLIVGLIPEDVVNRYGVSVSFMSASFDGGSVAGEDPELVSNQAFDSFELGFMGKHFWRTWWEDHWVGLGAEGGAAFMEHVAGGCRDKRCRYSYPASVEAFASASFDYAWGARDAYSVHLTVQPSLYSSHTDTVRFMLPVMVGFEL
jgi:hypothetical protein